MTTIDQQVALVTGSNRGLGREFVTQLLERGAAKVYATARDVSKVDTTDPRVVALQLDVSDPESVQAVAAQVDDLTLLINNAAIDLQGTLFDTDQTALRSEFETNFFGPVRLVAVLADRLVANAPGAVLNVHSALSWVSFGGTYPTTKSALWSATNGLRLELAPQGVQVVGLHVGYIDTDMVAGIDVPKTSPADVVKAALDGLEAGEHEVLADEPTRQVKAGLSAPLEALYPQLTAQPAQP